MLPKPWLPHDFTVVFTCDGKGWKATCDYAGTCLTWETIVWRPSQHDAATCVKVVAMQLGLLK